MGKKRQLKSILASLSLLVCAAGMSSDRAEARGGDISGGGSGLVQDGRFVFFDLRSSATHLDEAARITEIKRTDAWAELELELTSLEKAPGLRLLEAKATQNPLFLRIVSHAKEATDWTFTNSRLRELKDYARNPNDRFMEDAVYQVAIHEKGLVILQKTLFDKLSPTHQAALIIHETLRSAAFFRRVRGFETAKVEALTEALVNGTISREQEAVLGELFPPRIPESERIALESLATRLDLAETAVLLADPVAIESIDLNTLIGHLNALLSECSSAKVKLIYAEMADEAAALAQQYNMLSDRVDQLLSLAMGSWVVKIQSITLNMHLVYLGHRYQVQFYIKPIEAN